MKVTEPCRLPVAITIQLEHAKLKHMQLSIWWKVMTLNYPVLYGTISTTQWIYVVQGSHCYYINDASYNFNTDLSWPGYT